MAAFYPRPASTSIDVYFTKNYSSDSWDNARRGLLWTFSFLGAELPPNSFDKSITWRDSNHFTLQLNTLGFTDEALKILTLINDSIKQLPEYKTHQAIALGQYVSILIGSSRHYYAITGVNKSFEELNAKHNPKNMLTYPVYKSSVSKKLRVLRIYPSRHIRDFLFVAEEGSGDILKGTFNAETREVFDFMPNGQLRFAIYNRNGNLSDGSNKDVSDAGKPAKCLWCHESSIQPLFSDNPDSKGFIRKAEFQNKISKWMKELTNWRNHLKGDIDFNRKQDHTFMELLYISYNEPSVHQLAQEWRISEAEARQLLKQHITHPHEEFHFLDSLFFRRALTTPLPTYPYNIRETGERELEFYKK